METPDTTYKWYLHKRTCPHCSKKFKLLARQLRDINFCSSSCSAQWHWKFRKAEVA